MNVGNAQGTAVKVEEERLPWRHPVASVHARSLRESDPAVHVLEAVLADRETAWLDEYTDD